MFRRIPKAEGFAVHYHENLKEGRILLQSCSDCEKIWHYPRPVCPGCGGREYSWVAASGYGKINSFTIIHYPPSPELKDDVPYVLAMVDLREGARMTAILVGEGVLDVRIDDAVLAEFPLSEKNEPGMPVFRRTHNE